MLLDLAQGVDVHLIRLLMQGRPAAPMSIPNSFLVVMRSFIKILAITNTKIGLLVMMMLALMGEVRFMPLKNKS